MDLFSRGSVLDAGSVPAHSVRYRQACARDSAAVEAMLRRSSRETIKARFNGGRGDVAAAAAWFATSLMDATCSSWIAEACDGSVVAVATACHSGDTAEVALIVQDHCQRRRIGVDLLARLARDERARGVHRLRASLPADRVAIARRFGQLLGWALYCTVSCGEASVIVTLP